MGHFVQIKASPSFSTSAGLWCNWHSEISHLTLVVSVCFFATKLDLSPGIQKACHLAIMIEQQAS